MWERPPYDSDRIGATYLMKRIREYDKLARYQHEQDEKERQTKEAEAERMRQIQQRETIALQREQIESGADVPRPSVRLSRGGVRVRVLHGAAGRGRLVSARTSDGEISGND
eukprot:71475_1